MPALRSRIESLRLMPSTSFSRRWSLRRTAVSSFGVAFMPSTVIVWSWTNPEKLSGVDVGGFGRLAPCEA